MKTKSDADICRENNWTRGDYIEGTNPKFGFFVVKITAVGESEILAQRKGCIEGWRWDLASGSVAFSEQSRYGMDLEVKRGAK